MKNTKMHHDREVQLIVGQVNKFYAQKQKIRITHGHTNSTRSVFKDPKRLIDTSNLNHVLEINVEESYALVEPNVSMEELVNQTTAVGLMPAVVPEFPGITVGGAVQGAAGESSSFKYGCVHNTCLEYEVVLPNGVIVTVSADEQSELFDNIPCSYGSIGIVTLIKIALVPASKYVQLAYHPVSSAAEAAEKITESSGADFDFVDGIMFSAGSGVVMTGRLTDQKLANHTTFHKATDEWFYLHAQRKSREGEYEETIPLKDYFFRYDRAAFWVGRFGFKLFHVPFNRLTRTIFAKILKTKPIFAFLHGSNLSQQYVIQDICLPKDKVAPFVEYTDTEFGIYPLWLCPLKPDSEIPFSPTKIATDLVINVGIWGEYSVPHDTFVAKNREFEQYVQTLGGRKVLYAHAYYSEAEFWKIYDAPPYEAIRIRYGADVLLYDIYSKTHVVDRYKPSLARGLIRMFKTAMRS